MLNIEKSTPFKVSQQKTAQGILTTLISAVEASTKDNIGVDKKSLLATYIYKKDETYKLHYTLIDCEGNCESFMENDGILPTLFLSPGNQSYVSVVPYHPNKELEISIPVFQREETELPKGNRPFTGKFIGISGQFSVFHDVDTWSDNKPDKLLLIEFKNNKIKKKHNVKVPFPKDNKLFLSENDMHLLAPVNNSWLHRQIDEKGNIIKERVITAPQPFFWQVLNLSFESESSIIYETEGQISLAKVMPNGTSETTILIDIKSPLFNVWQPVKIAENSFVMQFTSEFGNGWFTIKDNQLLEFFYNKEVCGYKNWLTGELLAMQEDDLIISGVNRTKENSYAVVFYSKKQPNKIIVLNKTLH